MRYRWFIVALCLAGGFGGAGSLAAEDDGLVTPRQRRDPRRTGGRRRQRPGLQGGAVRRAAGRRAALAAAPTGRVVDRGAGRGSVRAALHPKRPPRPGPRRFDPPDQRRLPVSQRLDRRRSGRTPAGHGLDSRRRSDGRRRVRLELRRRQPGAARGRAGHDQLPPRALRLSGASAPDGRIRTPRLRQLRRSRPDRGARVGAAQHRGVRRRPRSRDHLRRIGRIVERADARGQPARRRTVSPRDR